MAQASRITQAAPGASIGRAALTKVQREERSRRTTIKQQEKHRQATAMVRSAGQQQTVRVAGQIRRENIAVQTQAYAQRNAQRNAAAVERRQAYNKLQSEQYVKRELVTQPIVQTVQPAARSGFVLLGVFAMLIVFYAIITHPEGFTGWLGGLGTAIGTFTQNGPLFSKNTGS